MSVCDRHEITVDQIESVDVHELVETVSGKRIEFLRTREQELDLLALEVHRALVSGAVVADPK